MIKRYEDEVKNTPWSGVIEEVDDKDAWYLLQLTSVVAGWEEGPYVFDSLGSARVLPHNWITVSTR